MEKFTTGKFIVIEGTDGSGKTTQTEALLHRLKKEGIESESVRFPQYEKNLFGNLIRECLDSKHGDFISLDPKIASVLYACDRFETISKIKKWLDDGKVVIADRYVSSNQIHQGGKIKDERERAKFLDWLGAMEYDTLGVLKPDIVLYLDVPFEISQQLILNRVGVKDLADSNFEYLKNSKEAGEYMLAREKFWTRISCAPEDKLLSIDEISEIVWKKVSEVLKLK
ncbi:MAG: dTMP kinase [Candidatus Paceibacterota bacterium]